MSEKTDSPLEAGKLAFGERPSEAARARFRQDVLDKATCPICRSAGLTELSFTGTTVDGSDEALDFALPVMTPAGRMFPIGGVYTATCRICGYIAQFFDAAVEGRDKAEAQDNV